VKVSWTDGPDTFRNACGRSFCESGNPVCPQNSDCVRTEHRGLMDFDLKVIAF
jgi:hypothetical protein